MPPSWDECSAVQKSDVLAFYQTRKHVEDEEKAEMLKAYAKCGVPRL